MSKQSIEAPGFFKRIFAPKLHASPDIEEHMTPSEISAARRNRQVHAWVETLCSDPDLKDIVEDIFQQNIEYASLVKIIPGNELNLTHDLRERTYEIKGVVEETQYGEDYNLMFAGEYIGISRRKEDVVITDISTWTSNSHDFQDNDKLLILAVKPFDTSIKDHGEIYVTFEGAAYINNQLAAKQLLKPELISAIGSGHATHR